MTDTMTEGLGSKRTSEDHPNYSIIKIGKNTEKSPGDLVSLVLEWEHIGQRWGGKSQKK